MLTSRTESGAGQRITKPIGWESPGESEAASAGISASFLKKRSKKLLLFDPEAVSSPAAKEQKFFGYFFSKK
jgi:hypothetical protein